MMMSCSLADEKWLRSAFDVIAAQLGHSKGTGTIRNKFSWFIFSKSNEGSPDDLFNQENGVLSKKKINTNKSGDSPGDLASLDYIFKRQKTVLNTLGRHLKIEMDPASQPTAFSAENE